MTPLKTSRFRDRRRHPRFMSGEGPIHDRVLDLTSKDRVLRGRRAIRAGLQEVNYLSRRAPIPTA